MRYSQRRADTNCMADQTSLPDALIAAEGTRASHRPAGTTERLVRETWRNYYCARLAEAQFGPDSVEASMAHSRALSSYRELRSSLREIDPYYRPPTQRAHVPGSRARHLKLVRDEPSEPAETVEP